MQPGVAILIGQPAQKPTVPGQPGALNVVLGCFQQGERALSQRIVGQRHELPVDVRGAIESTAIRKPLKVRECGGNLGLEQRRHSAILEVQ